MSLKLSFLIAVTGTGVLLSLPAMAQGVPLPGAGTSQNAVSAPAPGPGAPPPASSFTGAPVAGAAQPPAGSAPVPGNMPARSAGASSGYDQLPISVTEAQNRLDELKALIPQSNPQAMQEPVKQLCEWLADMADAHNRLAVAFSKQESLKPQCDVERQTCHKFSQLKNQAQLLKADLLIKQRRYPEALGPLVDIVIAEPKSATGATAYKRLREIGFAEEIEPKVDIKAVASTAPETAAGAEAKGETAPVASTPPAATAAQVSPIKKPSAPVRARNPWLTGTPFGGPVRR